MIPTRFHPMRKMLSLLPLLIVGAAWSDDPEPGHSLHGEAFDEGPRQMAHLMQGVGDVEFRITTTKADAQLFFNQGIGQLHGFWYYEAERSFRQVAMLDPDCAMAYWGLAMANVNNEKRAKAFLVKASERKSRAAVREQMWIGTLEKFYKDDQRDKKQRALDYISDLESIVQDFPQDIEAKAFLVWKIWDAKGQVGMTSRQAVNALLDQIFAANPNHPAHHYRIHLWDDSKPALALGAASQCGQAAPGIAHMWHMPGHIFSKLRRFDDAVWQQSAATRTDHAYMIADLVLPDQIHNYAHNEEWLVRNLNELGRAADAEGLAESLIRIPRHPTWNTLEKGNSSASYGRTRLIETYLKWQQWQELIKGAQGPLLAPVVQTSHDAARLHVAQPRIPGRRAFRGGAARLIVDVSERPGGPGCDRAVGAVPGEADARRATGQGAVRLRRGDAGRAAILLGRQRRARNFEPKRVAGGDVAGGAAEVRLRAVYELE